MLKLSVGDTRDTELTTVRPSLVGVVVQKRNRRFMVVTFGTRLGKMDIVLWSQDLRRKSSHLNRKIKVHSKYVAGVTEMKYRILREAPEFSPYENLMALKFFWVDKVENDRDVINMAKYQKIVVVEVDEMHWRARQVQDLSKITEGMFSARRIDSFFFVDKETLGMVMNGRLLLIDWKRVEIKRLIELVGLPQVLDDNVWYEGCFDYWYDTKKKTVSFRVGASTLTEFGRNREALFFISNLSFLRPWFTHSGYFSLSDYGEPKGVINAQTGDYRDSGMSEVSRLLDNKEIELMTQEDRINL